MTPIGLDHLVLTVTSAERSLAFYRDILGFEEIEMNGGRCAVRCGIKKINLHAEDHIITPDGADAGAVIFASCMTAAWRP